MEGEIMYSSDSGLGIDPVIIDTCEVTIIFAW